MSTALAGAASWADTRLVPDVAFLPLTFALLLEALRKEPEPILLDDDERAEARGLVADVFFFVSID